MNSTLQRSFEKIEQRKSNLLSRLDKIEEGYLTVNVTEGSWSVVQVLRHLSLSEEMGLNYVKKKILAGDQMPNANVVNHFKIGFVNRFLLTGIKYKAPSVLPSPEDGLTYQDVCIEWYNLRQGLKKFLDEYPDKYLHKAVYKHAIAGRTDLKGMLVFLYAHLRHHEFQIDRILNKIIMP